MMECPIINEIYYRLTLALRRHDALLGLHSGRADLVAADGLQVARPVAVDKALLAGGGAETPVGPGTPRGWGKMY